MYSLSSLRTVISPFRELSLKDPMYITKAKSLDVTHIRSNFFLKRTGALVAPESRRHSLTRDLVWSHGFGFASFNSLFLKEAKVLFVSR